MSYTPHLYDSIVDSFSTCNGVSLFGAAAQGAEADPAPNRFRIGDLRWTHIDISLPQRYDDSMRTTVDIFNSLDQELRQKADRLGISFKEALNRAIAAGLPSLDLPAEPYRVKARACGTRAGVDWLHLNRMADELEDEERAGR